jgi:hypothetical protein
LPREGNGCFGIFHTQGYMTEGSANAKFPPPPSLMCPKDQCHLSPQK